MLKEKLLKDYRDKMLLGINDMLEADIGKCAGNYNYHKMVASMLKSVNDIDEILEHKEAYKTAYAAENSFEKLTDVEAKKWVANMENSDGTKGEHWNISQTNEVAKSKGIEFTHISPYCWYATLNMIYSDYFDVAKKHNVNTIDFYVDMSKAFLFDKDAKSPAEKLTAYYNYIAK